MISYILSKIISMCMGLLYPAYCSYKAVKTKNVKEYVHWMMYWIVFSIFSFFEVFVDMFIGCWFPFYYELKIIFILWMLSPQTRGGSVLYRRLIHPMFTRHENEIDAYLADFKLHASNLIVRWGATAFNYVTELVMSTVLRAGSDYTFLKQKKSSFSLDGFDEQDMNRNTHQQQHHHHRAITDNEVLYSERENPSNLEEPVSRQRRSVDRNVSIERDMNRHNGLPKPYSMMNLGMDEGDQQAPPKVRSSTRKKKEFGNYTVVTSSSQDMSMPVMFGWYPSPNVAPDLNTASLYIQQPVLPSSFMSSPAPPSHFLQKSPVEVVSSEKMDTSFSSYHDSEDDDILEESDYFNDGEELLESESDFFDCEMVSEIDDEVDDSTISENFRSCSSASGKIPSTVQRVSKKSLQTFEATGIKDGVTTPPPVAQRKSSRPKDKDLKRNSMSALQSKSTSSTTTDASDGLSNKSKVKKSLSNSDLKLVKPTSLWSTSSFRRVLGPFRSTSPQKSSSATSLKRSGSNTSRASLNLEKKRKSDSNKVDN